MGSNHQIPLTIRNKYKWILPNKWKPPLQLVTWYPSPKEIEFPHYNMDTRSSPFLVIG